MAPLKMVSREKWGAKPPKKAAVPMTHPILFVRFAYVEVRDIFDVEIVKKVQWLHMDVKGYDDIECSFVVGRDGSVYEGRGWFGQPEVHVEKDEEGNYLEIGLIGQMKGKKPNDPAVLAMIDLLQFGIDNKYLDENYAIFSEQKDFRTSDSGSSSDSSSDSS